jgi:hypothetical protein
LIGWSFRIFESEVTGTKCGLLLLLGANFPCVASMKKRMHLGSPMYQSTHLYGLVMKMIYGPGYATRYHDVAAHIPNDVHVVEIAPGDAQLYQNHLKGRVASYLGLEISPAFLDQAARRGIPFQRCDIRQDPVPEADVVVMQAALYQFIPQHQKILRKMIDSARLKVIVAEPIRHDVADKHRAVAKLAGWLTTPPAPTGYHGRRFDHREMEEIFSTIPEFEEMKIAAKGRERLAVFRGAAGRN